MMSFGKKPATNKIFFDEIRRLAAEAGAAEEERDRKRREEERKRQLDLRIEALQRRQNRRKNRGKKER